MTGHGSIPRSIRSRSKQIERGKPMTQRLMTQTLTETTSWEAPQTSPRARSKQMKRDKPMTQRLMTQTLTETTSWQALQTHYEKIKDIQLRKLFADDPTRGERMTVEN